MIEGGGSWLAKITLDVIYEVMTFRNSYLIVCGERVFFFFLLSNHNCLGDNQSCNVSQKSIGPSGNHKRIHRSIFICEMKKIDGKNGVFGVTIHHFGFYQRVGNVYTVPLTSIYQFGQNVI